MSERIGQSETEYERDALREKCEELEGLLREIVALIDANVAVGNRTKLDGTDWMQRARAALAYPKQVKA